MLVYVADEYPAFEAGAGAKTLEASIVRLYVVLMIVGWFFSGWVRVACARLSGVHEVPPRGPGPGERQLLRGHLFI